VRYFQNRNVQRAILRRPDSGKQALSRLGEFTLELVWDTFERGAEGRDKENKRGDGAPNVGERREL